MPKKIDIVPGSTKPKAPMLDLTAKYPNGNTVGQVIRFQKAMHSFFKKHSRLPELHEMTTNQKMVWLRMQETQSTENVYHVVPRWKQGFLLELCVEEYLRTKRIKGRKIEVHYDPVLDVIFQIDLMIWGKPVQIKSMREFRHTDGMHYLVVENFHGILTPAHKQQIHEFVEWLRG